MIFRGIPNFWNVNKSSFTSLPDSANNEPIKWKGKYWVWDVETNEWSKVDKPHVKKPKKPKTDKAEDKPTNETDQGLFPDTWEFKPESVEDVAGTPRPVNIFYCVYNQIPVLFNTPILSSCVKLCD